LVAVIAMLVLGPERMVKHAYHLGRWARKLSRYWHEGVSAFREQLKDIEEDVVPDRADLPNLTHLKELAAEFRLEDELTGSVSAKVAPDATARAKPETGGPAASASRPTSPTDPTTASETPTSYSAWRPRGKPKR
jgi:Sec-independent protein translocase protein TatA